uniref:MalT-like TPR region domain-containing protein n=1 Tax=Trichuris muris TaxID=70415 RepID=A0A5S6Q0A8_TRIMR
MSDAEENTPGAEYSRCSLFIQSSDLFKRSFSAETADECIAAAVRCLTLAKISCDRSNATVVAQWHCMLARAYWLLKGLGPQTCEHAKSALQVFMKSVPITDKQHSHTSSHDKKLQLNITMESLMLAAKALRSMRQLYEANQFIKKALHIFKQNKRRLNDDEQIQWTLQLYDELSLNDYDSKRLNEASTHLDIAIQVAENIGGTGSSILVPLYIRMARLLEKTSNKAKALEYYERAYTEAFSEPIDDIPKADALITAVKQLTRYAKGMMDDKKLSEHVESAVAVYARTFGERDSRTVETNRILEDLRCNTNDENDSD